MTISSTTRTAGPFTGNGVAYLFPFAFKAIKVADVYVVSVLIATGVETVLALGPGYTVALNASQDSNPGGTVILPLPLAAGYRLIVTTDTANLQPTVYLNQGGFYPEILSASLDRATILIQQLQEYLDLALQFPITDPILNTVLPSAEIRAGQLLGFDSAGNVALLSLAGSGTVIGAGAAVGVVDGGNKIFTFVSLGTGTPSPLVFAGGIFQTSGALADYVITFSAGSTWQIAFTLPPVNGPIAVVQFA